MTTGMHIQPIPTPSNHQYAYMHAVQVLVSYVRLRMFDRLSPEASQAANAANASQSKLEWHRYQKWSSARLSLDSEPSLLCCRLAHPASPLCFGQVEGLSCVLRRHRCHRYHIVIAAVMVMAAIALLPSPFSSPPIGQKRKKRRSNSGTGGGP